MNYVERVVAELTANYQNEPEYLQATLDWIDLVRPVVDAHPEFEKMDLLTRMVEPDKMYSFRVSWADDQGMAHTNVGYRVQFNNAIGPYKGGLRFQPQVNASVVKFLGFEQTYKNAMTGLPIGGGAGGANFDPRGKSEREIMRFCQAFMTALYRHIGADTDVPAGDIGVGQREIGYLYGQYKRLTSRAERGVLTGKGTTYGGSLIRQKAAGYGAVYFLEKMLEQNGTTIEDKTIIASGFGNMTWGVCRKVSKLGGKVVTISGPDGYVYDPDGVVGKEKLDYLIAMRQSGADKVEPYAEKFGVKFYPNQRPWGVVADIAMPCATQNELDVADAQALINNDVAYYVEGANMPATRQAMAMLRGCKTMLCASSKSAGCGGVAVSALEMAQNSVRYEWSDKEVNQHLKRVMGEIFDSALNAAKRYDLGSDLVAGANIAAFEKIAGTMMAEGLF
ncbi:NADP-specific glutamate dehydrogenase [Bengtsoniella intestinalis]|uniref:NADP-specific glutamate dehydrogenase n=1 Tax=Bengtsoniella intestinalis TaxID=3073143 RepID=UPI00391F2644